MDETGTTAGKEGAKNLTDANGVIRRHFSYLCWHDGQCEGHGPWRLAGGVHASYDRMASTKKRS